MAYKLRTGRALIFILSIGKISVNDINKTGYEGG
jgi:hypothetical protein